MKKLIAGNWKMNLSAQEGVEFAARLDKMDLKAVDVVICAPFVFLPLLKAESLSNVKLGAQNVSWADSGAFTGEISPKMLIEAGAEYVIVGHSERRAMFNETDQTVNMRLKKALEGGLKPILCVGETENERDDGLTDVVLRRQINEGLKGITAQQIKSITIAYEPVWAIGTSKSASPKQADEAIEFIHGIINRQFGAELRVLYGGSMNASNAKDLLSQDNINGGLIGGASLKIEEFYKIIKAALE